MENQKKQPTNALAKKMGISLVCGIGAGMALLFSKRHLSITFCFRISRHREPKKPLGFFI